MAIMRHAAAQSVCPESQTVRGVYTGVVPIVHDSGGPKADIVRPERTASGAQITGYRCTSIEDYAEAITTVLCMDQQERLTIAAAARR